MIIDPQPSAIGGIVLIVCLSIAPQQIKTTI